MALAFREFGDVYASFYPIDRTHKRRRKDGSSYRYRWTGANLCLSAGAVIKYQLRKQLIDLKWDEESGCVIVKLGGSQRMLSLHPSCHCMQIAASRFLKQFDIPVMGKRRLPIVDFIDDELWIEVVRPLDELQEHREKLVQERGRLLVNLDSGEGDQVQMRLSASMKELFTRLADEEGRPRRTFMRHALLSYAENNHPEIYHEWFMKALRSLRE